MSARNSDRQAYSTYDATRDPSSPALTHGSSDSPIDEARDLVQRCAEPRPVGDSVKSAINRAARRLGFNCSRTKDLWYGDARRIDAREMDQLRLVAEQTELASAVGYVELVRKKMLASRSASDREAAAALGAALRALGAHAEGSGSGE